MHHFLLFWFLFVSSASQFLPVYGSLEDCKRFNLDLYIVFFKNLSIVGLQCVLVSGIQQSDSVTHTYMSIFQILSPYLLLQNIEYSSLCYTVGPCWLSTYGAFECIILHSFLNCYYGYHRAS